MFIKISSAFYLGFGKEMVKRRFLISNVMLHLSYRLRRSIVQSYNR
jgi:hypothetical protein